LSFGGDSFSGSPSVLNVTFRDSSSSSVWDPNHRYKEIRGRWRVSSFLVSWREGRCFAGSTATCCGRNGLNTVVLSCLPQKLDCPKYLGGGARLWVEVSEGGVHVVGEDFLDRGNCERTVVLLPHFLLKDIIRLFCLFAGDTKIRTGGWDGLLFEILLIKPFYVTIYKQPFSREDTFAVFPARIEDRCDGDNNPLSIPKVSVVPSR
jgi:hypothetical protein